MGIPAPRETHTCPGKHCPEQMPYHLLACRKHWFSIPTELRNEVNRLWRAGGGRPTEEYLAVRARAVEHLQNAK